METELIKNTPLKIKTGSNPYNSVNKRVKNTLQYRGRFTDVPDAFIKPYYRSLQVIEVARRSRAVDRAANLFLGTQTGDPGANVHLMVEIVAKAAAILERDYHAGFAVLLWDDETEDSAQILEELAEKGIRTIKVSDLIPDTEMDAYRIPRDHHPTAAANKLIAQGLARLADLDW